MSNNNLLAVLRHELTEEEREELRELFPGAEFKGIDPSDWDETISEIVEAGAFGTVLRPETLVKKALGRGYRFFLKNQFGDWVELIDTVLVTKPIPRPQSADTSSPKGY